MFTRGACLDQTKLVDFDGEEDADAVLPVNATRQDMKKYTLNNNLFIIFQFNFQIWSAYEQTSFDIEIKNYTKARKILDCRLYNSGIHDEAFHLPIFTELQTWCLNPPFALPFLISFGDDIILHLPSRKRKKSL